LPTAVFFVTDGRRMGGEPDQSSLRLLRSDRSRFLAGSWRGNYSTARTVDSAFGLRFSGHYSASEARAALTRRFPKESRWFQVRAPDGRLLLLVAGASTARVCRVTPQRKGQHFECWPAGQLIESVICCKSH
jgi:hypothetical protein